MSLPWVARLAPLFFGPAFPACASPADSSHSLGLCVPRATCPALPARLSAAAAVVSPHTSLSRNLAAAGLGGQVSGIPTSAPQAKPQLRSSLSDKQRYIQVGGWVDGRRAAMHAFAILHAAWQPCLSVHAQARTSSATCSWVWGCDACICMHAFLLEHAQAVQRAGGVCGAAGLRAPPLRHHAGWDGMHAGPPSSSMFDVHATQAIGRAPGSSKKGPGPRMSRDHTCHWSAVVVEWAGVCLLLQHQSLARLPYRLAAPLAHPHVVYTVHPRVVRLPRTVCTAGQVCGSRLRVATSAAHHHGPWKPGAAAGPAAVAGGGGVGRAGGAAGTHGQASWGQGEGCVDQSIFSRLYNSWTRLAHASALVATPTPVTRCLVGALPA